MCFWDVACDLQNFTIYVLKNMMELVQLTAVDEANIEWGNTSTSI